MHFDAETASSTGLHAARHFEALPNVGQAVALIERSLAGRSCAFEPSKTERPMCLYGGGQMGQLARAYLAALGQHPVAVIDRAPESLRQNPAWDGITVYHPEDVPSDVRSNALVAVCVATAPYVPLEQQLTSLGFEDVVPFYDVAEAYRDRHPLSNGWFSDPLDKEDTTNIAAVLERWDDDLSRAHHLQFLAWRVLREEWSFEAAPIDLQNRFFIPEILDALRSDETFVDAGAHTGEVITRFLHLMQGKYRNLIAIEPDPQLRAQLTERLSELNVDQHSEVLRWALSETPGRRTFHAGLGYASQLSETGQGPIDCQTLDGLALQPSFIKLHLEGHELPALKGAEITLKSHRPILAATVYHNADGLWKTARWLGRALDRYRLLFRAHSWCGTGAVLYAIPEERHGR